MKREYELTHGQLDRLLDACKPVPYIVAGGMPPPNRTDIINAAWDEIGDESGFVGRTAMPIPGKGDRFVMAEPKEPR